MHEATYLKLSLVILHIWPREDSIKQRGTWLSISNKVRHGDSQTG